MTDIGLILRTVGFTTYPLLFTPHTEGDGHLIRVMSLSWNKVESVDLHPVIDEVRGVGEFEEEKLRNFLRGLHPKIATKDPVLVRLSQT